MIESADPGYDWIFTHDIKGLITKYGGAASHMAIRCAEFNLPAAIGSGEIFDDFSSGDKILSESYFQHVDHFTRIQKEQEIAKIARVNSPPGASVKS